jgi:hypothetical protein
MLEPVMFSSIGFLTACLLMVAFVPLIHDRAVRLTARRLQAATPLSVAEMQAEKDLLRAEFAMSLRRLEMSVEDTKKKEVERLREIGNKTAEIHQLRTELDKTVALLLSLQARDRTHRSVTRRVTKLLRYLSVRSQRASEREAAIPASDWNDADDWGTLLARFRAALQKGPMAHGGTQDSSRAA